jgi:TrmH family RNA methyltransferase
VTQLRLEGFHAVKHALRFGARLTRLITNDTRAVEALRRELAPDLDLVAAGLVEVPAAQVVDAGGRPLPSPLLGWCDRPSWTLTAAMARPGPVVVLEQPRHLGNAGAVVRVAAAAGAAAVVTTGDLDPWHPSVVRAAAGLHLALPVLRAGLDEVAAAAQSAGRPLVAVDGDGAPLHPDGIAIDAVLVLGTERAGLSPAARAVCAQAVSILMRDGVSSLNLATAAAVCLYAPRHASVQPSRNR